MRDSNRHSALNLDQFKRPKSISQLKCKKCGFLRGITLIELLVVISIIGILASTAVPNLVRWLNKNKSDALAATLFNQLQYAREQAINRNEVTSLCGADENGNCVLRDFEVIQIFIDSNKNKILDNNEQLLLLTKLQFNGSLRLNAHKKIAFKSSGASTTPASFIYCPHDHDSQLIRRITISFTGRPYIADWDTKPVDNKNSISRDCPNWQN